MIESPAFFGEPEVSNRVTIKSIARDLGISHMTVSRALSDHPNVQQKTRERVQQRARELGYVRNAAAMAMRGDGTKIVGLLLPNIVNEFYARFADTMAKACKEHGYQLIIHLTDDNIEIECQSINRLREVQARAVVMVPAPGADGDSGESFGNLKVIQLIRHRPLDVPSAAVLINDHDALGEAVVRLAAEGHRRIAYIGATPALSSGRERRRAFLDGLAAAGLKEDPKLQFLDAPSFREGERHARRILTENLATAMVCGGFEISNGALSAYMDVGRRDGNEAAFVGYGDPSFYAWIGGGVSSIHVPVEDLAYQSVKLLDDETFEDSCGPGREKIFRAEVVIRRLSPQVR